MIWIIWLPMDRTGGQQQRRQDDAAEQPHIRKSRTRWPASIGSRGCAFQAPRRISAM